jgi:hypothetical protein
VTQWPDESRISLLIAAVIFSIMVCLCITSIAIIDCLRGLFGQWAPDICRGMLAHSLICAAGALFYFSQYFSEQHIVVLMPDGGEFSIMRNLLWSISAPLQWYTFIMSFATATEKAQKSISISIYVWICAMHLFGVFMVLAQNEFLAWLCGALSTAAFVLVGVRVFELPLVPETASSAHVCRCLTLLIWTAYPVVAFGRMLGFISPWTEQNLLYTSFDVLTKCVELGGIIVARVLLVLRNLNGTVELVMAAKDLVVVVDENFEVLDSMWDSAGYLQSMVGKECLRRSLLDSCLNREHRDRIKSAAAMADGQLCTSPSPKCLVVFQFQAGTREVLTECHVSREVQGRRLIGIGVASASPYNLLSPADAQDALASEQMRVESEL